MADHYVDSAAAGGGDGSEGTPWNTIAQVNAHTFTGDDFIYFKRGSVFREQLTVGQSGTDGHPITYGAYGTGANPIINGADAKTGWGYVSATVWSVAATTEPKVVMFDGVLGIPVATLGACNGATKWFWESNLLYTYAVADPLDTYDVIEATARAVTTDALIHFNAKSYITIDGIDTIYSNNYGIANYASGVGQTGLTVKNCNTRYTADGGIVFDSDTNMYTTLLIDNCTVDHSNLQFPYGTAVSEGITVRMADGFEVKNCTVSAFYEEGIDIKRGATNGSVHDNEIIGGSQYDARPGLYFDGASHVNAYRNKIHGCRFASSPYGCGVGVNIEDDSYPNDDVNIYYNLIYDNDMGFSMQSLGTANNSNINFNNNVVAYNEWGYVWGANTLNNLTGTNNIKNNIFWACSTIVFSDATTGNASIAASVITNNFITTGATTETVGTNPVQAVSPLFVDAAGYDFTLQSTSPCINAGVDVGLTSDYGGTAVWGPVTIGAYQYTGETIRMILAR